MIKVGITGGIGSGKSTLCRHFRDSGVPHYDSDSRAKALMVSDMELRAKLVELFGDEAYLATGEIDRGYLAQQIFRDEAKREAMNSAVHPVVLCDFEEWVARQGDVPYVLMESALLFDSGFDANVDFSVAVLAPEPMRIERVVARDGSTAEQVKARIDAQMGDDELHARADYAVVNIFEEDMEGAAQRLDQIFKYEAIKRERSAIS